jgi:hypothetical protein
MILRCFSVRDKNYTVMKKIFTWSRRTGSARLVVADELTDHSHSLLVNDFVLQQDFQHSKPATTSGFYIVPTKVKITLCSKRTKAWTCFDLG